METKWTGIITPLKYFCKINEYEFQLSINYETDEIHINGSRETADIDLVKIDEGLFHLILENKSYLISVSNTNIYFRATVGGEEYNVEIEDNINRLKSKYGETEEDVKSLGKVYSPMPGLIVNIYVSVGDEVQLNTPLLVLEAMKMENEIKSPVSGKITDISVTAGQNISTETLLMTIE